MGTIKSFTFFIIVSLALHAPLFIGPHSRLPYERIPIDDSVIISTVHYPHAPSFEKKNVLKAILQKKSLEPVLASRHKEISNTGSQPKKQSPLVPKSVDLLSDPRKGKEFVNYFSVLKEKIAETIRKNYFQENQGMGSVCLVFILRADGSLENTWVDEEESTADNVAKNFAMASLKASAPFAAFPKNWSCNKISFSVTVFF